MFCERVRCVWKRKPRNFEGPQPESFRFLIGFWMMSLCKICSSCEAALAPAKQQHLRLLQQKSSTCSSCEAAHNIVNRFTEKHFGPFQFRVLQPWGSTFVNRFSERYFSPFQKSGAPAVGQLLTSRTVSLKAQMVLFKIGCSSWEAALKFESRFAW